MVESELEIRIKALQGEDKPKEETVDIDPAKPTLLVIDDDEAVLNGIYDKYRTRYNVLRASNGDEGLRLIREHRVNAVLLDIFMPGMDGFQTKESITRYDPYIPVIFNTGFAKDENVSLKNILRLYSPWGFLDKKDSEDRAAQEGILLDAVKYSQQVYWERDIIERMKQGLPLEVELYDYNIETIINGNVVADAHKNGIILVKDFADPKVIMGTMPDNSEAVVEQAMDSCEKAYESWGKLTVKQRLDILKIAGEILENDDSLDEVICRTNLCAHKFVIEDRKEAAALMKRAYEYLSKGPFDAKSIEHNLIKGVGTVGIFIQSSMYMTGAYGIINAILGGNSLLLKLDSKDPYAQYQVANSINKAWKQAVGEGKIEGKDGPPIQIVSWDTKKNPNLGQKVMRRMNHNLFMGGLDHLLDLNFACRIKEIHLEGQLKMESINELRKELMPPGNITWYVSHMASGYVHKDANLKLASFQAVWSALSHKRACKRLHTITVHPEIYDTFIEMLRAQMSRLRVLPSTDKEADIVYVSDDYWGRKIKPTLKKVGSIGYFMLGEDIDAQGAKLIEMTESLESEAVGKYLDRETMYPVLTVIKGDEKTARQVMKGMGRRQPGGKILEAAVWTQDYGFFEREFYNSSVFGEDWSWGYHLNQPTTKGLGNVLEVNFTPRDHERRWCVTEVSRRMPYKGPDQKAA